MERLRIIFRKYAELSSKRREANGTCLSPEPYYSLESRAYSKLLQINELPEKCDVTLFANDAAKSGELDYQLEVGPVREILTEANKAVFKAGSKITVIPSRTYKPLNWTHGTFRVANWDIQKEGQKCSLERSFAYRINGTWYIRVELTNAPVHVRLEHLNRQYITEFVRDDFEPSLSTVHFAYEPSIAGTNGTLVNSTTILQRWSGRVRLPLSSGPVQSATGSFSMEGNMALNEAHENNAIAIDIADGTIRVSNIAILALPMFMSLIPVAFIVDAFIVDPNSAVTVAYLVFTDIFSALPLLIKGVELMNAVKVQNSVVAIQLGDEDFLQMEIFSAECAGVSKYRKWGIIFVVTSTAVMVIGVVLELITSHVMKKRRKEMGDMVTGPFGVAPLGFSKVSLMGRVGPNGLRAMKNKILRKNSDPNSGYSSELSEEELEVRYIIEKDRRYSLEGSVL